MENHNLNMIMKRESLNKSIIINKRITTYDVGISGPGMEQAHKCGRVKPVGEIPTPSPLDNWISNSNTDINKR
jgi:hypothetical protein